MLDLVLNTSLVQCTIKWVKTFIVDYEQIFTLHKKMKFSVKGFFSKCDQIRSFLRIWSHLLKKSLMKNFIFVQCYLIVFYDVKNIVETFFEYYQIFIMKLFSKNSKPLQAADCFRKDFHCKCLTGSKIHSSVAQLHILPYNIQQFCLSTMWKITIYNILY